MPSAIPTRDDLKDFKVLLEHLFTTGQGHYESIDDQNYNKFSSLFNPFPRKKALEGKLKSIDSGTNGGFGKDFLYIMPPQDSKKGTVAILHIGCEAAQDNRPWRLRMRLGIFIPCDPDHTVDHLPPGYCFVGYRFETPEGHGATPETTGAHDYYHVQPITGFEHDGPHFGPAWWPVRYPAFPVVADSPASLLGAMMVSLYGGNTIERLKGLRLYNTTKTKLAKVISCSLAA
ncbi:MAG: hypothetical protein HQM03_14290 [Magnetococcales bacterium]|nr:hypothetical protein [Magnetococcales bacterium]